MLIRVHELFCKAYFFVILVVSVQEHLNDTYIIFSEVL